MRLLILSPLLLAAAVAHAADASSSFAQRIEPILKAHCTECHSGKKAKAELDLSGIRTPEQLSAQRHHWFRVLDRVEAGEMPPKDETPLPPAEKHMLLAWLRGEYSAQLLDEQRQVGRSKFRRLSRNEYANTVLDIFGVRPPVGRLMPADGRVDGYDKVSAALPFSTATTEAQMKIAEDMIARMFEIPQKKKTYRLWAVGSEQSKGHVLELPDGWNVSFNSDTTSGPLRRSRTNDDKNLSLGPSCDRPGMHRLHIRAYGYQTDKPLPVGIYVGHTGAYPQIVDLVKVIEVPPGKPAIIETEIYLRTRTDTDGPPVNDGIRLVPLGLGVPVPKNSLASVQGKGKPGLALQYVDVEELEEVLPGQRLLTADMPPSISEVFMKNGTLKFRGVVREELQGFVQKCFARAGTLLFRRDLGSAELTRFVKNYMAAVDAGSPLKPPFVTEMAALMTAPDFLCVMEQPGRLTGFALASRLSYLLWNSGPDTELLGLARTGKLANPSVLRAQTERLLTDRKSARFVNDFLDQWLGLWALDNTTPDKDLYPEFDDLLKISNLAETRATFGRMLEKNLSVRDFVAPQWAMINDRLARHYQLPEVAGFAVREVKLPVDSAFGGLWTHASTMKATANGTLTSPIKRGVWMVERLMGIKIPPPPPTAGTITPDTRGAKTLREQLELHRKGTSCAACHAKFDPYGFALESFDVTGAFRTHYRTANPDKTAKGAPHWVDGLPVDPTGVTPDGKPFAGIQELRAMLAKNPEPLARGFARHLLTYATGEPAAPLDQLAIEAIVQASAKDGYGVRTLIHALVQSELFHSK